MLRLDEAETRRLINREDNPSKVPDVGYLAAHTCTVL